MAIFAFTTHPATQKKSMYQPGGVASGFDANLKMRYLREGVDSLGRWIWQEFGWSKMVTRIYTIYRVNDGSESASGTSTAWYQQKCLLEEKGIHTNPRKQVINDLCEELRPIIDKGDNIIIGGDFNECILSPESLSEKFNNIGLFNILEARLQTSNLPRTHTRGSRAIDHIWATQYIVDNISYAGYSPFGHIWDSDHRGLFVDLKATVLFPTDDIRIVYSDFRKLKSSISKQTKKYMEFVSKNWDYHKIDHKFAKLKSLEYDCKRLEFESQINKLDE